MLQNQLARGNNGLIKTKYLTFGIDADSIKAAKPRLERIETDILNNFKRLGVAARTLDGKERLSQLHAVFHMDEQLPFQFEWDWLAPSGLSTKDFIAPSSFEFRTGKQFRMGKKYGAVSFLQILAPELNDRLLADFLDMESSLIVSMHIQSVDQVKAIKTVKRKITDLDRSKIEEQKKAIRRTERYEHVMTIQECYAQMGADYNEVFRRLYNEAMIRKFVLLFPKDDSFHNLEAALKEQNVKEAFRAAHTLKGVCQNLGFSNLYAPAVTLTETLRAGQLEGTAKQFAEVEKQYRITMAAIQALD